MKFQTSEQFRKQVIDKMYPVISPISTEIAPTEIKI
jgi:hypothetical protein